MAAPSAPAELLAGLHVVDLTDGHGALAARLLAELGATVVRVEDPWSTAGRTRPPLASDGTSLHHLHRNAGKSVLALDPADDDAHVALDALLAGADACVVARGWGHGDDRLAPHALGARHPHLVVVALTPLGLDGPCSSWRTTELVDQALAGVVHRSGVPELPPVAAPGSFCEDVGAVLAAVVALVGVHGREAGDGAGEVFDVSSVLALAHCTDTAIPLWSLLGNDQVRNGAGLYPLFACTDGLARIVLPMSPGEWRALIRWLGDPPEWTGPEWERSILAPPERELVMARLPAMFATRTRDEVTADADANGIRVTPVLTAAEVLAGEHVAARATFAPVSVGDATGALAAGFVGVEGVRAAVAAPAATLHAAPVWPARPRPAPSSTRTLPLDGIRVLEIGNGVAAPEAGRVLGEWGAEVVKVESRARPDFQRRVFNTDMNPAFASPNRNKLLFGADLAHPDGLALVRSLVAQSDVVLENNATGVLARLGLGWDVLRDLNPSVSLVSTQLYGDRGPWATRKGYGPSARAIGGLTWLWAHGPDAPRGVQTIHPDHLAGRLVALGSLAAVHRRRRTGTGSRVDVAQFEAVMGLLGDLLLAESLEPGAARPTGNVHAEHVPWNLYRGPDDDAGAESWLAVCVTDDDEWERLVSLAAGAIADAPERRRRAGRVADRDAIDAEVAGFVAGHDTAQLEARLQAAGIAAGRALHPRTQVAHPHFVARGFAVPVEQPGSGPLVFEGPAAAGSRSGLPRCGPAPLPGQHTRELCTRLLGLDDAAIESLAARGAIDLA